jgi:hypothetical protein
MHFCISVTPKQQAAGIKNDAWLVKEADST